MNTEEEWLVEFMAPWCGHCKRLEPEWKEASRQLKGEFNLGVVDATQEQQLAQEYGISGYPTIKHFKMNGGKKVAEDYRGERIASAIVDFASRRIEETASAKPLVEITSAATFGEECNAELGGICVIAFLPHIYDDQAAGRNARLEKLRDAKTKIKQRQFRFMWVVGGENGELEEKLGLGFGFPAVVALSPAKKKYAVMRQSMSVDNIVDFLNNVLRGKESTADVKPFPPVFRKYPAWDGKDAQPPAADDDDL